MALGQRASERPVLEGGIEEEKVYENAVIGARDHAMVGQFVAVSEMGQNWKYLLQRELLKMHIWIREGTMLYRHMKWEITQVPFGVYEFRVYIS